MSIDDIDISGVFHCSMHVLPTGWDPIPLTISISNFTTCMYNTDRRCYQLAWAPSPLGAVLQLFNLDYSRSPFLATSNVSADSTALYCSL